MSTNYHTDIIVGAVANAATFNAPDGELDAAIGALHGGSTITNDVLLAWAEGGGYQMLTAVYDSDNVAVSGTVKWPDGSGGAWTRTAKNATWLAVDGYTVTHTLSSQTITQATITRDASGNVTIQPALTIA